MPLAVLALLGFLLLAFVAAGPWIVASYGYAVFIPCMVASGGLTIAAAYLAPSVPPRAGLQVILAQALTMRLLLVGEDPLLSTDIYRYVWDGRVQGAGINPYLYVPADPALTALRDTVIYPGINRADYAVTAYPPAAQMFFFAVTRVAETLTAMRVALVACEAVVIAVMIDLLRRLQLPQTAVVVWAWHPLVIWETANNGHVDALMVALLMLAVWLLVRFRRVAGAIAVALAALVKPYALVALPVFWRPWDWRVPLAVSATILLAYAPYLAAGRGVLGFVTTGYLSEEGLFGGEGFWLVALLRAAFGEIPGLSFAYVLASASVLAWLALRTVMRTDTSLQAMLRDLTMLLMAALFLLSPNYAWYVLLVVPFVALGGGMPAWAMTLGAILLYRPLLLPDNDLAWKTLAILPFIAAVAFVLMRRRGSLNRIEGASQWTS